jgi:hypothetical protein
MAQALSTIASGVSVESAELARWNAILCPPTAQSSRRMQLLSGCMYSVFFVVSAAFVRHSDLEHVLPTAMFGLLAVLNFASYKFLSQLRLSALRLEGASIAVEEDGIHVVEDARTTLVRWREVERVVDAGDAILVLRRRWRPAVPIPRRCLPDGGTALWTFFESRLIDRRLLHRPRRTDPIVNVSVS